MSGLDEEWCALRPREPSPSQCCGGGCKPCVYDVYEEELARWERAKATRDKSALVGRRGESRDPGLSPDAFTAFSVSSVRQLTEDAYLYRFQLPGNGGLRLGLGQHIVLRGVVNGLEVQRAYTPISPGNAEGYFEVLIKDGLWLLNRCEVLGVLDGWLHVAIFPLPDFQDFIFWRAFHPKGSYSYSPAVTKEIGNTQSKAAIFITHSCYEAGLMSQYIKTWKEGDTVFWRGPFGGFPYRPNKHGELLMLASGTGLAPMLPILQSVTEDEEDETFVTLVGCFCTFEKIYLKPLLQDLARYWNIRIFYVLSQEASLENLPWSYQENTYTGRLNEDLIKTIINSCRRKPFVLICGSSAFTEDMNRYLKAAGVEEDSCFVF